MGLYLYCNGQYVFQQNATVSVFDRGYLFSDGVYEVIAYVNKKLIDAELHFDRLYRSLSEIDIKFPYQRKHLELIINRLVRMNRQNDASIYIQVTRGISFPRKHQWGEEENPIMTIGSFNFPKHNRFKPSTAITCPDERWKRPDIKSISLLPNVLAKQKAIKNGAFEAIFYDEKKNITEASHSNVWIVDKKGQLITPPNCGKILSGITRYRILNICHSLGIHYEEKIIKIEDIMKAQEVFISSSIIMITPIANIDGTNINNGQTGTITSKVIDKYRDFLKYYE